MSTLSGCIATEGIEAVDTTECLLDSFSKAFAVVTLELGG